MIIHSNETTIEALVNNIIPAQDGYGHELDLEILSNESPDPKTDFLKPQAGQNLKVFGVDLCGIRTGSKIRAKIGFSGGPFGQKVVLRSAETLSVKP